MEGQQKLKNPYETVHKIYSRLRLGYCLGVDALIERKKRYGSIAKAALLGLPIILSLSRVFREWAGGLVVPYRTLMPIYVLGLLYVSYQYRKTLHEIIVMKLKQDHSGSSLEDDEQATVSELQNRRKRIDTVTWLKRNFWLLVGFGTAIGVDCFLWTLADQMGKSKVLSGIFAVLALGIITIYYWKHEYFSKQEKLILDLI